MKNEIIDKILKEAKITKKIVISVPHFTEPKEKTESKHPCDFIAGDVAKSLKTKLENKGFSVTVVFGNIPREKIDLNRQVSESTEFRKILKEKLKDVNLLIDCHSYSKNSAKYSKWEVVALKHPKDKNLIADMFIDMLTKQNVNAKLLPGFLRDDIVMEALENNQKAILLEHNEDTNIDVLTEFEADAIDKLSAMF